MATSVTGSQVRIDGLRETIRGLKAVSPELARAATRANKEIAKRYVLPEAQDRWASQRIKPSVANRAVVAAAGADWAGVRSKAKSFPYGAGVTFGARKFGQFRPWVGNQFTKLGGGDYIVSPAVASKIDVIEKQAALAIEHEIIKAIRGM